MLKRETFVDAISKIKKHEELMDRLDTVCREFGSFRPSLDFGNLHLQALLEVLKDAMDDEYDYISWGCMKAPTTSSLGKRTGRQFLLI